MSTEWKTLSVEPQSAPAIYSLAWDIGSGCRQPTGAPAAMAESPLGCLWWGLECMSHLFLTITSLVSDSEGIKVRGEGMQKSISSCDSYQRCYIFTVPPSLGIQQNPGCLDICYATVMGQQHCPRAAHFEGESTKKMLRKLHVLVPLSVLQVALWQHLAIPC